MPATFLLAAGSGDPTFLDLPWERPLESWSGGRLVEVERGISRHVVRFADYDGRLYALKELPLELAQREWRLLRALTAEELPVVQAAGVVHDRGAGLDAVLITRHLEFAVPYRTLFGARAEPGLRETLLNAMAELLVRLHAAGFFWGDCSLSNALFRRDAGSLSAYLVDAETGELHSELTSGQREHDVVIAEENIVGELYDLAAQLGGLPSGVDPIETALEGRRRYEGLWDELTRDEVFGPGEQYRVDERLARLNELGFDVEEMVLERAAEGYRLRVEPRLVEPGHHRRRLLMLTGLSAQERQARRMLNDLAGFRARLEQEAGQPVPESVAAYRWRAEVFEPAVAAVPPELWSKREAAEVFHELLQHRWYLSERGGSDVGWAEAVRSYVSEVLPRAADERRPAPGEL